MIACITSTEGKTGPRGFARETDEHHKVSISRKDNKWKF